MAKKEYKIQEIKGYPDYWASEDGKIWTTKVAPKSNPTGKLKVLRPRIHPSGYLYYGLFIGKGPNKQRLWRRGHRLIYETFVGKIKNGLDIDHINGDRHDNSVTNLRMVTHSENCLAAWERKKSKI